MPFSASLKRFLSGGAPLNAFTLAMSMFLYSVLCLSGAPPAFSTPVLPSGGSFVSGSGTISSSGQSMNISQSARKGIIDWNGFSIGQGGSVFFNNGSGATLNRVTGGSISSIAGLLKSTGSVYLVNPSGIVITNAGQVITGGDFVASTLNISNSDFLNNNYTFSGNTGTVFNSGTIASSGNIVLVGTVVTNTGTINSSNGTASMASGTQLVLIPENGPSGVLISPSSVSGNVTNSGIIKAASVYLSSSGGDVYALAGNNGGLIQATGTKTVNGQVWLTAPSGTVSVDNTITSSNSDGSGGTILIDGLNNYINSNSILNASGTGGVIKIGLFPSLPESLSTTISSGATLLAGGVNGGGLIETSGDTLNMGDITVNANGGEWLMDPQDFTIDTSNNGAIDNALSSGNVTITAASSGASASTSVPAGSYTGTGSINVNAPLSWSSGNTLTLSVYNSININSTVTVSGNGGLALNYNGYGQPSGSGAGSLNIPLTPSSFIHSGFTGSIRFTGGTVPSGGSASAPSGSLAINGTPYTLVNDYNIGGIGSSGYYALATNITAPTSFTPIGEGSPFTGTFNGLGNTVGGLTIGTNGAPYGGKYAGLFGQAAGAITNLGVVNASIYGSLTANIGGLAGYSTGYIINDYFEGIMYRDGQHFTGYSAFNGGLIGGSGGGEIINSYWNGENSSSHQPSKNSHIIFFGDMSPSPAIMPTTVDGQITDFGGEQPQYPHKHSLLKFQKLIGNSVEGIIYDSVPIMLPTSPKLIKGGIWLPICEGKNYIWGPGIRP